MRISRFLLVLTAALVAAAILAPDAGAAKSPPSAGASQPASASRPAEEQGITDPPGLPLKAKLILKKDAYSIPAGQSGEEFAKGLKTPSRPPRKPPAPPEVDMAFELTNTGGKAVTIPLGGDATSLNLRLEGPGAVTVPYTQMRTMEYRIGKDTKIEPGKSLTLPIAKLLHGQRGDASASYWTAPGEYTLTASYVAPSEGIDGREDKQATITAAPVKVRVTGPEDKPNKPAPASQPAGAKVP
jgi:hypothetical protein